jgi:integrase
MIQQDAPQDGVTGPAHGFAAMHFGNSSASFGEPGDDYLDEQIGDRLTIGANGTSGDESNSAGSQGLQSKTQKGNVTPCSRMTIGRFVETKFIPEHVAHKRSSGRWFYRAMLKHLLIPEQVDCMFRANPGKQNKKTIAIPEWPYLSDIRLCDIQPEDIYRLMSAALAHGYSIQTVKHIRNVTSAIYSHAMQEGYFVGNNPVSTVRPPKHRRKHVVELTPAQAIEALSIMQYPERELTLIGVFTGMSPAEIIGLQWGQVNLSDEELNENGMRIPPRTICVRRLWYRGKPESVQENCVRDLTIPPPLLRILQRLRRRSHSTTAEDCVLVTGIGTPINQNNIVSRRLAPIARQLGVPSLSWQAFRRTPEVLASELEKEFGFSASPMSMRIPK